MELLVEVAEKKAAQQELSLNMAKYADLFIVPDAIHMRYKVLMNSRFKLADRALIHQLIS